MYISYMCIYEQHIEIVIGWHMVYMCVHYIFTQLTRIKGLQDSFTLVCDVEAGAQTSVLIPQQKSFKKKSVSFLALAPNNQYEAVSDTGMNHWIFSSG